MEGVEQRGGAAERVVNLCVAQRPRDGNRCCGITSYCSVDLAHAASCSMPLYWSIEVSYEVTWYLIQFIFSELKMWLIILFRLYILFFFNLTILKKDCVVLGFTTKPRLASYVHCLP